MTSSQPAPGYERVARLDRQVPDDAARLRRRDDDPCAIMARPLRPSTRLGAS